MAYNLRQGVDVLKFARKIIGLEKNITINSNIYEHSFDDHLLDKSKDIIEIYGNEDKPIELDDVIDAFKEMKYQFKELTEKDLDGRTYHYEGIHYNNKQKIYEIYWGS